MKPLIFLGVCFVISAMILQATGCGTAKANPTQSPQSDAAVLVAVAAMSEPPEDNPRPRPRPDQPEPDAGNVPETPDSSQPADQPADQPRPPIDDAAFRAAITAEVRANTARIADLEKTASYVLDEQNKLAKDHSVLVNRLDVLEQAELFTKPKPTPQVQPIKPAVQVTTPVASVSVQPQYYYSNGQYYQYQSQPSSVNATYRTFCRGGSCYRVRVR